MTQNSTDTSHFELHITADTSGKTTLDMLSEKAPLSKQKLKTAMTKGAVWQASPVGTHRIRRAKKIIDKGDVIYLYYDEVILNTQTEDATLIADEGEYSVWDKPYGMYSQGSKWGDHCTLYRWVETHLEPERPAFPVHRLDRAASGLMLMAHSKKMAKRFSDLFKNRQIQKQYSATVEGKLDELVLPYTLSSPIDDKPALSRIITVEQSGDKASITIEIETGRKHQIRRHLSAAGYPIVGDRLYGSGKTDENLQLRSNYLAFKCPVSGRVKTYSL
ncbi:MAG TPA: RluA family pseudouridine synthase [Gammaproteobacteria bacterium]|nr:RluA family pseudouridine synthase [Gammaproteobacteria bacterium]